MSIIRYLHPFKGGDLLCLLPGIKHLYHETGDKAIIYQRLGMPAYFEGSDEQCMTLSMFNMLKPLIEFQDYIESFEIWEGEKVDVDVTPSRDSRVIPLPNGSIHFWTFFIVPEMQCNLFIPWIETPDNYEKKYYNKVIINRTARYQNPYISYYFLKEHSDHLLFSGTEQEYKDFCKQFNLEIPHIKPKDFLELGSIITVSKFFLGNQSFQWHLADASKSTRLLECSTTYPNTYPTGANGYAFLHQKALEILFEKLISQ